MVQKGRFWATGIPIGGRTRPIATRATIPGTNATAAAPGMNPTRAVAMESVMNEPTLWDLLLDLLGLGPASVDSAEDEAGGLYIPIG